MFILLDFVYLRLLISIAMQILKDSFLKMSFSSISVTLTSIKFYSVIPIYILKVFTVGFVHISFAWFIAALFASVDFNYIYIYI